MVALVVFLTIIIASVAAFIGLHLRALTEAELHELANKRRQKAISQYFAFSPVHLKMSAQGKNKYSIDGKLFLTSDPLHSFPAIIAALLKYKKHEWIIFGFEKEKKIIQFWINKGESKSTVKARLSGYEIVNIAAESHCSSVIRLHNHPNSDPNHYTSLLASKQDLISAKALSELLAKSGLNFLDFVCERGRFIQIHASYSFQFLPEWRFAKELGTLNGRSKWGNLKLHLERLM
jgi:DNA repair protein RadC